MKREKKEPPKWDTAAEIRAEQKEALKNMPFKKKVQYFWEYYRLHVFIAIVAIVVAVSIIEPIVNRKPYSFYAMMVNSYDLDGNEMAENFAAYADLDTDNFTCFIDTAAMVNIAVTSQTDLAMIQRVIALAMAGDLDVLVADGPTFLYYGYALLFTDLRDILTAEELARYEGRLFYIDQAEIDRRDAEGPDLTDDYSTETDVETAIAEAETHRDPEPMENPVPIGIFMGENEHYSPYEPIFGFVISSSREETARLYLDFLEQ
jgi:hypothetical protein